MEWMNANIGFTKYSQDSSIVTYGVSGINDKLEGAVDFAKFPSLADTVDTLINSNPIMMFSKTYCSYSKRAKTFFYELGILSFTVIELDQHPDGDAVMQELQKKTGQATVPNIFIAG